MTCVSYTLSARCFACISATRRLESVRYLNLFFEPRTQRLLQIYWKGISASARAALLLHIIIFSLLIIHSGLDMYVYQIRLVLLLAIALAYAIFDTFNKRNVPNAFVYGALAVGFVSTLFYPLHVMIVSVLIALVLGAVGYFIYRLGFMGAGDFFEFMTISLILPIQPLPALLGSAISGVQLPFMFSVFIATAYVMLVSIIVYYLFLAKKSPLEKGYKISMRQVFSALVLFLAYMLLLAFIWILEGIGLVSSILVLLIAVPSCIIVAFDRLINLRMISMLGPDELDEGDMIAVNLMKKEDIAYFKKHSQNFGRLVTKKLKHDIRNSEKKLPVYRNAVPLALFTFFGVIISLAFGNLILLLISH